MLKRSMALSTVGYSELLSYFTISVSMSVGLFLSVHTSQGRGWRARWHWVRWGIPSCCRTSLSSCLCLCLNLSLLAHTQTHTNTHKLCVCVSISISICLLSHTHLGVDVEALDGVEYCGILWAVVVQKVLDCLRHWRSVDYFLFVCDCVCVCVCVCLCKCVFVYCEKDTKENIERKNK